MIKEINWSYLYWNCFWMSFSAAEKNSSSSDSDGIVCFFFSTDSTSGELVRSSLELLIFLLLLADHTKTMWMWMFPVLENAHCLFIYTMHVRELQNSYELPIGILNGKKEQIITIYSNDYLYTNNMIWYYNITLTHTRHSHFEFKLTELLFRVWKYTMRNNWFDRWFN